MAESSEGLRAGLAAGEEAAFESLVDEFGPGLFRTALAILRRPQDAEDAVQETFIALVRSREQLARVDDLAAYVFSALRNAAARLAVQRGRQPMVEDRLVCEALQPVAPESDRAALDVALEKLPIEQREVVALKIDAGLTFEQIGRALGVSGNTAASRYRYALEKLRALLREP